MKTKTKKHSRGPWAVGIETDDHEAQIISADGQHLATVEQYPLEANAHLIASAPEMLEALNQVERAWVGDGIEMSAAVDSCLLAIAHAEGRELGCI